MCFSFLAILFFSSQTTTEKSRRLPAKRSLLLKLFLLLDYTARPCCSHAIETGFTSQLCIIDLSERGEEKPRSKLKDNFCTALSSSYLFWLSLPSLIFVALLLRLITFYWMRSRLHTHLHADLCASTTLNCTMMNGEQSGEKNTINQFINQRFFLFPFLLRETVKFFIDALIQLLFFFLPSPSACFLTVPALIITY